MTRNEIIFNYNQAIQQAKKLEQLANSLSTLSTDRIDNTAGSLKNAWQSDHSFQYYSKLGKVQGEIKTTSNDIKKIARSIRTTAQTVRNAEIRALEIAESRSYR